MLTQQISLREVTQRLISEEEEAEEAARCTSVPTCSHQTGSSGFFSEEEEEEASRSWDGLWESTRNPEGEELSFCPFRTSSSAL